MAVSIQVSVQVAKETSEVMALVVKGIKTAREGGDLSALVPDLLKAIDGLASIPEEAELATWDVVNAVALGGIEIAKILSTPKAEEVVRPVPVVSEA